MIKIIAVQPSPTVSPPIAPIKSLMFVYYCYIII
jgi:hypothetical protein